MTVEELTARLKDMPQDDLVLVHTKSGKAAVTDVGSGFDVLIGDGTIRGISYLKTEPYKEKEAARREEKRTWNKTDNPKPYEQVEILMKDGKIHTDRMVKTKYGSLTWRNWDDRYVTGWRALR